MIMNKTPRQTKVIDFKKAKIEMLVKIRDEQAAQIKNFQPEARLGPHRIG